MIAEVDEQLLPPDYEPSDKEDYMNPLMLAFFKRQLLNWRGELLEESAETIHAMQADTHEEPDIADRASTETDRALELRTRDRERKLISKIDEALQRIEDGEYGYCEETGDPIGIARLIARPIATLSIEAQERHERKERTQMDQRV
ncbi:MAG: RNA polymerase-binding protein DksA [Alphaproteobacteria bacterium]